MSWFHFLCFTFFLSTISNAADGSGPTGRFNIQQKIEKKEASRWTLQEWLAQKERNRLMDLWLAMYSPSPYEFFIEGSYLSFSSQTEPVTATEGHFQSYRGGVGAYAAVVGLEGTYENNTQEKLNDLSGSLHLRVLGNAVQGTHLIFHYGLRTRNFESSGMNQRISNQFAGADLNLYLTRYFGLMGTYNAYLPTEHLTLGSISGTRSEAGLFIDFEAARVFGNWFADIQTHKKSATENSVIRTGIQSGLILFF